MLMALRSRAFGRCLSHEGGALRNGASLMWQMSQCSPCPLPRGDTRSLRCRSGPSPNHTGTLTSDFQPSEQWEINVCCLKATLSVVFYYSSSKRLRRGARKTFLAQVGSEVPTVKRYCFRFWFCSSRNHWAIGTMHFSGHFLTRCF